LFQIITSIEQAFREGGNEGLRRFWRQHILKKPEVLWELLENGDLPKLIGAIRTLVAPQYEARDHLSASIAYWQMQLSIRIWIKLEGDNEHDDDMAEKDPHEIFMAELVRDTVEHIEV